MARVLVELTQAWPYYTILFSMGKALQRGGLGARGWLLSGSGFSGCGRVVIIRLIIVRLLINIDGLETGKAGLMDGNATINDLEKK